jgi:hypothetical protein
MNQYLHPPFGVEKNSHHVCWDEKDSQQMKPALQFFI